MGRAFLFFFIFCTLSFSSASARIQIEALEGTHQSNLGSDLANDPKVNEIFAEYAQQQLRIGAALQEGGDLTQLSEEEISLALLEENRNRAFQGRRGEDVSGFETNISRLEAEKIRRQGGPRVNIASADNLPGPTESFVTLEGAREIFERTGSWPQNMSVWDLGQRFGRDPNQYLSNLDGPKPPPAVKPPVELAPLAGNRSQSFSITPPSERVYNSPFVANGDRVIPIASIVPNPRNTVVLLADPRTDHNGAIEDQEAILRRTGASTTRVGTSRDRNGNPDPIADVIRGVQNQFAANGGQPVDAVIAGHGRENAVRLAPGPNGELNRESVARLNEGTRTEDGQRSMLGRLTLTACDASSGVCPGSGSLAGDINADRVYSFTAPVVTNGFDRTLPNGATVRVPTIYSTPGQMVEVINHKGLDLDPGFGNSYGRSFGRSKELRLWN